jgi:peptidoglycan/LPS O-acetylase OafA/YrhL
MSDRVKHIPYLDGWRGLAILFVIADHFSRGAMGWAGGLGVELFFVLSGLLMADILFIKNGDKITFFVRRFSRVYPALFLFATALFVVSTILAGRGLPKNMALAPMEYFSGIAFFSNYYQVVTGSNSVLGHLWSLAVEEQTYFALAIIAWLAGAQPRKGALIFGSLALFAMLNGVFQTMAWRLPAEAVYWRTDVRSASILLSASIYLGIREWRFPPAVSLVAFVAGIATFVLLPNILRYTLGTALLALSINSIRDGFESFKAALSAPALRWVGLISFSLYLWQQPFYKVAERVNPLATPVLVVVTFGVAYCSYRLIEGPFRTFINNWWGKPERRSPPQSIR